MLIPSTKVEDERLGPVADEVKEQVKQTGQEAVEHGKQIAQDTVQTATKALGRRPRTSRIRRRTALSGTLRS